MGRSGNTKKNLLNKKNTTRTKAPFRLDSSPLKTIKAKYEGKDPITEKAIGVGDMILYDTKNKKAYRRDSIFASAGLEGGIMLQDIFNERPDQDPVALLGVFLMMKARGISEKEIKENRGQFEEELNRWSRLVDSNKAGATPTPSVLMLIEELSGREDLREKLEDHLKGETLNGKEIYKTATDPELNQCLLNILDRLENIGDPRDTYGNNAKSWWTDFGAVSSTSNPGMAIRRSLKDLDLDSFARERRAAKILKEI